MKKILLIIFMLMIALSPEVLAQDRAVTGKVTSDDGSTLPGVNVILQGSTVGTTTDIDGNYRLNVPAAGGTLTFSFIGYVTEEVEIGNRSVVDVKLTSDVKQLSEVVVTALGIERAKNQLGYATQEVGASEILRSQENNLVNSLNGKVAGVSVTSNGGVPGASATIRIRGNTSIIGDNSPLFVIDGVPVDNTITAGSGGGNGGTGGDAEGGVADPNRLIDINPNDVASINVLKGTAASALYGQRAANGVIIITTKKGSYNTQPRLNFSTSYSIETVNKLPDLQDQYAQGSYGSYRSPSTGQLASFGPRISDLVWVPSIENRWDKNGEVMLRSAAESAGLASIPMTPYDNLGTFYQPGNTFDNYLSLSGGGDKSSYFVSLGYMNSNGIIPNSNFKRITAKISGDRNFTEKLKVSTGVTYSNNGGARIQQGSNLSGVMLGLLRTPPSFDNANGFGNDAEDHPEAYQFPDGSQRNYRGGGGYDNPFWTVNKNTNNSEVQRMIGSLTIDYAFTDWLTATARLGNDFYYDQRSQITDIGSRNFPAGNIYERRLFNHDFNSDFLLSFKHKLSEQLTGRLILGHNYYRSYSRDLFNLGTDLSLPGFKNISNAANISSQDNISLLKRVGIFFDAQVGYKEMLFINVTGRNDWSSALPVQNNSYFQPTVNGSFIFSELLEANPIFSSGQVRASWGQVKRDAPLYALTNYYSSAANNGTVNQISDGWTSGLGFPFGGVSGFTLTNTLGNDNIKPETQTTYEFGLVLGFLNKRLNLDATYYNTTTTDQIVNASISSATGFESSILNGGEIEVKGIELVLDATPVTTTNFTWSSVINFTSFDNTVISLTEGLDEIPLGGFTGTQSVIIPGQQYGVLRGGVFEKHENGKILIGEDGFPVASAIGAIMGNPIPDWTAGWRNTLTVSNLSLSFLWDFRKGGDMWNGTKGALTFMGMSEITEDRGKSVIFDGVNADGQPNNIQVVLDQNWYQGNGGGFGSVDEHFVEETSWVRLRDVSLSYALPKTLLGSVMQNFEIVLAGRNLLLFTPYTGIDPETNLTGGAGNALSRNAIGLDYFQMPNTKSYTATLRVTF